MNSVNINGCLVGENEPVFIIAEAGVNHNGDVETAKKMIVVAKESGADAIKFQSFKTDSIVSKHAEKAEYQKVTTGAGSQYEMIKNLELSKFEFEILSQYAIENNIIFMSSPFDIDSANELDQLGVGAFKIASGEITNHPLLREISSKNKPIILSTGMASFDEIKEEYPDAFTAWAENPLKFSPMEGESTLDVKGRALRVFNEITEKHNGDSIAIVAHGGINRVILCELLGIPLENIFRIEQDFAALNVIELWDYPVINQLNFTV